MPTDYENMLIVVGCVIGFVVLCLVVYVFWIRRTGLNNSTNSGKVKSDSNSRFGPIDPLSMSRGARDSLNAAFNDLYPKKSDYRPKSDPRHDKIFVTRKAWAKSDPNSGFNPLDLSFAQQANLHNETRDVDVQEEQSRSNSKVDSKNQFAHNLESFDLQHGRYDGRRVRSDPRQDRVYVHNYNRPKSDTPYVVQYDVYDDF